MATYRSVDTMSKTLVGKSVICQQFTRQSMHAMDMVYWNRIHLLSTIANISIVATQECLFRTDRCDSGDCNVDR